MNELSRQQRKARQITLNTVVVVIMILLISGFFRIQVAGGENR